MGANALPIRHHKELAPMGRSYVGSRPDTLNVQTLPGVTVANTSRP